jgi:hypothetical protein
LLPKKRILCMFLEVLWTAWSIGTEALRDAEMPNIPFVAALTGALLRRS